MIPLFTPSSLRHNFPFALLVPALLVSCSDPSDESLTLVMTGSSTVAPLAAYIAQRFEASHPGARIEVQTGGSSRGIADASSGLAAIGMASRSLKPDETGLLTHPIAVDGVSLIAHASNPVSSLTRDQVIAIYRGEIQNWRELGGPVRDIVVANKAEGTGTLEVFLSYFGLDSADIAADLIVGENQQAIKTVAGNPDAIAYVSLGAAAYETDYGSPIKLLQAGGVSPTPETVASGAYPISRPLLLLTKGEPEGLTREFIDFARAPAVHDLVKKHLFVPAP